MGWTNTSLATFACMTWYIEIDTFLHYNRALDMYLALSEGPADK